MARFDTLQAAPLTPNRAGLKGAIMTRTLTLVALAATAALAACDNSDHTIVAGGPNSADPMANAVQNLEDVKLPAAIVASNAYRCKDNSLVYIDWLNDDTARLKPERNGLGTTVAKGEDGTYTGEGRSLSGAATDQTVTIDGQSCSQ